MTEDGAVLVPANATKFVWRASIGRRIAWAVVAFVSADSAGYFADATREWFAQVAWIIVAVMIVWLGICNWRMGVFADRERVVVRGWMWSRTVPRDRISAVTNWPALRWWRGDRERWTPIHAMTTFGINRTAQLDRDRLAVAELRAFLLGH